MGIAQSLFSTEGRSGRRPMALVSLAFVFLCVAFNALWAMGTLRWFALAVLLVAAWPAQIALPIRRFHDMDRSWWWILVFWGGALVGLFALLLDLSATAGVLSLSPFYALTAPEDYLATLEAYNATSGADLEEVGASGLGGISTAAIFLLIQFGWLHFIPGSPGENRFGAAPSGARFRGDR